MSLVVRVRSIALTAAVAFTSSAAWGADAADAAAAEALFNRGRQLMGEGKFAEACPKLAESQRLDPGTGTALNLADCYERQGRTATAWVTWLEAATLAKQAGQSDREEFARSKAKSLEGKLPRLEIQLTPGAQVNGLRVTRNGTEVRDVSFGVPLPVDPGEHTIEASAPGYQTWRGTVRVDQAGGQQLVRIPVLNSDSAAAPAPGSPAPGAAPAAGPAPSGPAPVAVAAAPAPAWSTTPTPNKPRGNGRRTVGIILTGVGAAGVAAGGVLALMASSANDDSMKNCNAADETRCNAAGVAEREDALALGTNATILTIVGGAALATGVVLWMSAPSSNAQVGALSNGSDARMVLRGSF
jgi:serine/threonine-protein kinase